MYWDPAKAQYQEEFRNNQREHQWSSDLKTFEFQEVIQN